MAVAEADYMIKKGCYGHTASIKVASFICVANFRIVNNFFVRGKTNLDVLIQLSTGVYMCSSLIFQVYQSSGNTQHCEQSLPSSVV